MPVTASPGLDLAAPILPGEGAAGLRVGTRVTDLPPELLARFSVHRLVNACVPNAVLTIYHLNGVTLSVENRIIDQIAVSGAYQGKLADPHGAIGLGSTVAEVEAHIGPVIDDDNLGHSVASLSGLGFTVKGDRVTRISVYRR